MGCNKKKKAFTLTELLVVVIVLGVLAGVAAPKFKRVLETRKTTEAENMLAAVRTEQEKRCIMGKNYLTDASKVAALASAGTSANYTYSLTSSGVSAASKGASNAYTIKMLSYKNGTLCCDGDGCAALNKSYVSCGSVTIPDDECSAESGSSVVEPTPEPEPEPVSDPESICGEPELEGYSPTSANGPIAKYCIRTRQAIRCDAETGKWVYGEWSNYVSNEVVQTGVDNTEEGSGCTVKQSGRCTAQGGFVGIATSEILECSTCVGGAGTAYKYNEDNCLEFWGRTCNTTTGKWEYTHLIYTRCDDSSSGSSNSGSPTLTPLGYVTLTGVSTVYPQDPSTMCYSGRYYTQAQLLAVDERMTAFGDPNEYYGVYKTVNCPNGGCPCSDVGQKYIDKSTATGFTYSPNVNSNKQCTSSVKVKAFRCDQH